MKMTVSDRGLVELAEHEGIVPAPYYDSVGVLTYGVGHTAAAGAPDPATLPKGMPANMDKAIDEALSVFRKDIKKYEARVNKAIKVPLKQHEFDALVSFDFNTGGIHKSRLTKAINAGDRYANRHFFGWLRPPELRKRRTAEERLFVTGDYDANGDLVPVWRVNSKGRLQGQVKSMRGADILKRMGRRVPSEPGVNANPFVAIIAVFAKALAAFSRKPK